MPSEISSEFQPMERSVATGKRDGTMAQLSKRNEPVSGPGSGASEQLRILRIATDLYPEVLGGGALHAHELSRVQAEHGHEVTVLTSDHGDSSKPRREERAGYEIRRYQEVASPFENSITPGMVPALWRLAEEHDIVHAHSHLYFSTNAASAISRLRSTPLVVTNHGLVSQTAPMAVQRAYAPVARLTFDAADRILCYTETDRRRLRDRNIKAPITVIHNGIDCEMFTPDAGNERHRRILFVGRLKQTKGIRQLVDAFAKIADDVPEVTLFIVGSGPLRSELETRVAESDLSDRVTFTGPVPNDELPRIYAESDVFALPSSAEGFPRTVLEALACGTPVVTSDLPQLASIVDAAGVTIPRDDNEALAAGLFRMLTDGGRREELGAKGRELVRDRFEWAHTVDLTTEVYYQILQRTSCS